MSTKDEKIEILWDDIWKTYQNKVYYQALDIVKREHWAEDVTMEVFEKLFLLVKFEKVDIYLDGRLSCLINILTNNIAKNFLRKEKNYWNHIELLRERYQSKSIVTDNIEQMFEKLEYEDIISSISDLKESYAQVLYMKYVQNFSVKEIAELINLKEKNVQKRIDRARISAMKHFSKNYADLLRKYSIKELS